MCYPETETSSRPTKLWDHAAAASFIDVLRNAIRRSLSPPYRLTVQFAGELRNNVMNRAPVATGLRTRLIRSRTHPRLRDTPSPFLLELIHKALQSAVALNHLINSRAD
jgi:hypothetical protein